MGIEEPHFVYMTQYLQVSNTEINSFIKTGEQCKEWKIWNTHQQHKQFNMLLDKPYEPNIT